MKFGTAIIGRATGLSLKALTSSKFLNWFARISIDNASTYVWLAKAKGANTVPSHK